METMEYSVQDKVAHLRFSRPESANAVNPVFCKELKNVMSEIKADDSVQAVSVTVR